MQKLNLVKDSTELRKTIAENPDLPIVVMVGSDAACSDYYYTYCSVVKVELGEVLDCYTPWSDEAVYNNRNDFEENLTDYLYENPKYKNISDKEFKKVLEGEKAKYESYWTKVIIVKADNY